MTNYYDHPVYQLLLAAIRAAPDDDLSRLVCADWLEENGEPERAEFVRVQVEIAKGRRPDLWSRERELWEAYKCYWFGERWAILHCGPPAEDSTDTLPDLPHAFTERGFLSRVRAPLAVLCGGECSMCDGNGMVPHDFPGSVVDGQCPTCHGTGRTPGVLRELLRREPLGAIEITDIQPDPTSGDMWIWPEEALDQWPELSEHMGQFAWDSSESARHAMSEWLINHNMRPANEKAT